MSHRPNTAKRLARPIKLPLIAWAICCCVTGAFFSTENAQAFPQNPDFIRVRVKPGHTPEFPRVIKGRVTDAGGKPISGALVSWGQLYKPGAQKAVVTTGYDGVYEIETNNVGFDYGLSILAKGYCTKLEYIPSPGPKSLPLEKDFQLDEDGEIEVSIVDEGGLPLTGFEVRPLMQKKQGDVAWGLDRFEVVIPGHERAVPVDDAGQCRLRGLISAPGGRRDLFLSGDELKAHHAAFHRLDTECLQFLEVTANGKWITMQMISPTEYLRSQGRFRIVIPNSINPRFRRVSTSPIYGQVVDTNGQPVRKFRLTGSHETESIDVDDPAGRFTLGSEEKPANRSGLEVVADGFAPVNVLVDPNETDLDNPVVIKLSRMVPVELQLIDQRSHNPIANAQIKAGEVTFSPRPGWESFEHNLDEDHDLHFARLLTSDSNGRFSFPERPGASTLIIRAPGYPQSIVTPEQRPKPDEDGITRISLNFGGIIEGITSAGFDTVTLYQRSTDYMSYPINKKPIDADGRFRMDSVAAGEHRLLLKKTTAKQSHVSYEIAMDVQAGECTSITVNRQPGPLKLTGRTRPFSGVTLTRIPTLDSVNTGEEAITSALEKIETKAKADVDGYFEMDSLNPGVYRFECQSFHYFIHYPMGMISLKTPSELHLNEDTHIDVVEGVVLPANAAVMPANPL